MDSLTVGSGPVKRPLPLQTTVKKSNKINPLSRWMILLATLLLPLAYFTPIWKIMLWAPQYPEGLEMKIWINRLTGSIDIINGLNHYIGMANIDESMFPELKFLTYIIAGIIALGLITYIANRQGLLKLFTLVILLFALGALIDMYIWGYKYGHNLDEHAAIKIEGESYQPPLIGYKQLLNFTALSAPDKAGLAFLAAGVLSILALVIQWLKNRKSKINHSALGLILLAGLFSCAPEQEQLNYTRDACDYCGMKLVDKKYGALIVTEKGKSFRFDDLNCMLNYKNEKLSDQAISKFLITDFSSPGKLIDATTGYYLRNEELKSPMGANTAAFEKSDSLEKYFASLSGEKLKWADVQNTE